MKHQLATLPPDTSGEHDARSLSDSEVSALTVTPRRHYGRWAIGILLLAVTAALLRSLLNNENIDKAVIVDYLFSSEILQGLENTLIITVLAMSIAMVLGTVVAAMRTSSNPLARWLAWAFAFAFRSTPVLVQLFFWFNLALIFPEITLGIPGTNFNLGQWDTNVIMTPLVAAVIGLGLSESAYYSEVVRSGLISVDPGQREAAQAIGMSGLQTFRKIVLPQTIRVILPPTGNQLIAMLKYSSLASVIGFTDLAGTAAQIYSVNLKNVELLIVISFWYFVATSILSIGQYVLERRYGKGYGSSVQAPSFGSRLWSNLKFRSSHS
ncbi:amino acid ABC transporter permease [Rhodococcus sp. KBS0724]|uniref:amino acid ABC transporter permease n=1 Tax=Rhodococcus sp. KBS0724 TaxID=1179674 RepID=UPI00110F5B60|nr:amino acid ABC transporter permease [Rhodococcus sp. KBS0724]TSD40411.1 amino acid ABC transporter permease [Rhodococcus sp. KBS0724]